jgi:hypothetical protein
MGELLDFFGADPVEVEFTASSRRLAVGSKTTLSCKNRGARYWD